MLSIYNCKLYKCSTRRDSINAAMNNPVNKELVMQLNSYIGTDDTVDEVEERYTDESLNTSTYSVALEDVKELPPSLNIEQVNDTTESYVDDTGSDVLDDTDISPYLDNKSSESTAIDSIKNSLNVKNIKFRRVDYKPNGEVWIYLDDSINLNNVMESIIDSISELDTSLEFNRLSRTENAIVFIEA